MRYRTFIFAAFIFFFGCESASHELGNLGSGITAKIEKNAEGNWGISILRNGESFFDAAYPLHIELTGDQHYKQDYMCGEPF